MFVAILIQKRRLDMNTFKTSLFAILVILIGTLIWCDTSLAKRKRPKIQSISCQDRDPLLNPFIKGLVIRQWRINRNIRASYYNDVCTSSDFVKQYYCNGKRVKSLVLGCARGCEDGACVLPEPPAPTVVKPTYKCFDDTSYGVWDGVNDEYLGPFSCEDLVPESVVERANPTCSVDEADKGISFPCHCEPVWYCGRGSLFADYYNEHCRSAYYSPLSRCR